MEKVMGGAIRTQAGYQETYIEVAREDFRELCMYVHKAKYGVLRLMFAADERSRDGSFRIYTVFSVPGSSAFFIITLSLREDDAVFPSLTPGMPAAHWYEREMRDMFGIVPEGHPDRRRLVLHDSFPAASHPLRKDWKAGADELREWGEGITRKQPYEFLEVSGEGIYEIPVGPVHAGIIEPGHFRFSALGETIFYLEPRLFYTHKGTEKHFEGMSFHNGVRLAERISGTSSFSHSAAYCMAVEKMMRIELTERAAAVRTLLIELERLYNHIGDIGNICAGTGLAAGYAGGALIKERLMQLNERITGSRYLRGVNVIGGVSKNVLDYREDILLTLDEVAREYRGFLKLLLETISHVERLEHTGKLPKEIALQLGVTGVAARASGIHDDLRKSHPHLLYDRLIFEHQTRSAGDVLARMMVRAEECECSLAMAVTLLEKPYAGSLVSHTGPAGPFACALGYAESPRGSVFYWVMSGHAGRPLRVKFRSPSFCNWPAVPYAVHGNIVPDFPLCNKSFNLSYSGCDM